MAIGSILSSVLGGALDSVQLKQDPIYDAGDIAWMLTCTALCLLMIPGVGFFYSGLARRKSALSLIWLSLMSTAVVSFQWFFWGYSLVYSRKASSFLGGLEHIGFHNVLSKPSIVGDGVPELVFAVYECMFAAITVALATGATAERGRMLPCVIFMFLWTTLVYDPLACWIWNPQGWLFKLSGLDFAGGTPVHVASGTAALVYSYMLGKRTGSGTPALNNRPHNITNIVMGTVFLWVGWIGFNAGSALGANMRAVMATVVTHLAACVGGMTWCLVDYRLEKKWSAVGFCSGVIAGLVAITPGAGYVPAWAAIIYGLVAGIGCNFATQLKYLMHADDALDIFAVHAVGGIAGDLLTGIFASKEIAHLDGHTSISGGWLDGNWSQLGVQLAGTVTGMIWSLVVSIAILSLIAWTARLLPVFALRSNRQDEVCGTDDTEMGEFAYDYVEHEREVKNEQNNEEEGSQVGKDEDEEAQSVRSLFTLSPGRGVKVGDKTAGVYQMQRFAPRVQRTRSATAL